MEIDGIGAIVTGGASGLGEATARQLAWQGANVAILDFDEARAGAVAREIGGLALQCDVSDDAAVRHCVEAARDWVGQPARAIVNCAGIGLAARIVDREGKTSVALFRKVIEVNLIGAYNVMTFAVKALEAADPLADGERGVIINTSSAACEDGQIGQTAYAASKGGIAAMCLPGARELARSGIRVMAIAPGLFDTPMTQGLPAETVAGITKHIPFPARLGAPAEFAQLAGDIIRNPYLNGTIIRLDGGARLAER